MISQLARNKAFEHPVLQTPGWWRRPVRLLPSVAGDGCREALDFRSSHRAAIQKRNVPPILITGGDGRLADGFVAAAELRGLAYRVLNRAELDIADSEAVQAAFDDVRPWAVINCAGSANVDAAEEDENACLSADVQGAENLARVCAQAQARLVTFSSDFVFDGAKSGPYEESDEPEPLNVYGESKALAEMKVRAAFPEALVIRPGKVFAPMGASDFLREQLERLARGERVRVADNIRFSPAYLPDLVNAALDLLIDEESGIWHLANVGAVTPQEFLFAAAELSRLDKSLIEGVPAWSLNRRALRPPNRSLRSARGQLLPTYGDALHRYLRESPPLPESDRTLAESRRV
jgi:dTDP-4-dehydrorhamnose reductase